MARSGMTHWSMLNSYVDHTALGSNSRHRLYILMGQCCICLLLSTMPQSADAHFPEPLNICQWPPRLHSDAFVGPVAAAMGTKNLMYNIQIYMYMHTHIFKGVEASEDEKGGKLKSKNAKDNLLL